jgi:hypothetical protein
VSELELRHYTAVPIVLSLDHEYEQGEPRSYAKPRGFWVSVLGEDDWPTWCKNEEFREDMLATEHAVTLAEDANILHLDTHRSLNEFTATYGIVETKRYGTHEWSEVSIDWQKVASEYQGIIIAPYQWGQRLDLSWYYGWDCASGCIWDLSAIASVEVVESMAEESA